MKISDNAVKLIAEAEGFDQPGRHPGGGSGVTIGVGYDLGFYSEAKFRKEWGPYLPEDHIERLSHAIGLTGGAARSYCSRLKDIEIPKDAAVEVFHKFTLPDHTSRTAKIFPGAENLPEDAQGALVSLVFNRGTDLSGDRRKEMKAIRDAIVNSKADPGESEKDRVNNLLRFIAKQFRSMKRIWQGQGLDGLLTRRENEAKLVESAIT